MNAFLAALFLGATWPAQGGVARASARTRANMSDAAVPPLLADGTPSCVDQFVDKFHGI